MRQFFSKLFLFASLAPVCLRAQSPTVLPPGGLGQFLIAQPAVDLATPVNATAAFDPPIVRVGEKTFYRVNVDATESSIQWPAEISAPAQLQFGSDVRGQLTQFLGNQFHPLTTFAYEMTAAAPGNFSISNFNVNVAGETVEIPAASLQVVAGNSNLPLARQLQLEISTTNVFLGQPFHVKVVLPAGPENQIEALREIQFNGEGLMTDKTASRQSIEMINRTNAAFICEMTVTPIASGPLKFSAQGFTAGREFTAPISIRGQVRIFGGPPKYVLLVSDPVTLNVRPLPEGELPGFTGALGKFSSDPPQLATNRLQVGEPVSLKINFRGADELSRFVPPIAPRSRDWQIIAASPPAVGFTLIPLTDDTHETPAIPFSYFDPATAQYVDLTIPSMPVTVIGEGLPTQLPAFDDDAKSSAPIKLSGLATTPGKIMNGLKPPQLRSGFLAAQFVPLIGLLALWQWDRRRRFFEAHPELLRRRKARRALRRKKRELQNAVAARATPEFISCAAAALRIAVAPQYPAHPQALVGADVLAQMDETEKNNRTSETVRKIFAAADAQFAAAPVSPENLIALHADVEMVLQQLEEKL